MARSTRYSRRRRLTRPKRSKRAYKRPSRVRKSRGMTRRQILNVTTTKKQDNMTTWIPAGSNPSGAGAFGDLSIANNNGIISTTFCPTYRDVDIPNAELPSTRSKTSTFSRGYREVSTIRCQGSTGYRMRRIVFRATGLVSEIQVIDPTVVSGYFGLITSPNGFVRQTALLSYQVMATFVFKGVAGRDWFSPFNAKVDSTRVTVMSDKTYMFNPPNQSGKIVTLKNWYPVNKTIIYDDDESGNSLTTSPWSSSSNRSAGDVFIFDIYQSNGDTTTPFPTDKLIVNHEGTYYWHEK